MAIIPHLLPFFLALKRTSLWLIHAWYLFEDLIKYLLHILNQCLKCLSFNILHISDFNDCEIKIFEILVVYLSLLLLRSMSVWANCILI